MIKILLTDLSRVLLFPKDNSYHGGLNDLYKQMSNRTTFRFWDLFEINSKLLNYYKSLSRVSLAIFTSEIIQEAPELKLSLECFGNIFSGSRLGISKSDPRSYTQLLQKLGVKPAEVVYIDDNLMNTEAAQKAGLATVLYTDNQQAISALSRLVPR